MPCSSQNRHWAEANLLLRSYHVDLNMDALVTAVRDIFAFVTGHKPKFKVHGGSNAENLALQNIQVSIE